MRRPTLLIINGLPASGKSTLAGGLANLLNLPVFKKDDIKEQLADSIGIVDLKFSRLFGKASYVTLYSVARELLKNKCSLIIEGNFGAGDETSAFVDFLKHGNYVVIEVLCYASSQILFDRFSSRKRHPIHQVLPPSSFEPLFQQEKIPSLHVGKTIEFDTSDLSKISYNELAKQIEHYLLTAELMPTD